MRNGLLIRFKKDPFSNGAADPILFILVPVIVAFSPYPVISLVCFVLCFHCFWTAGDISNDYFYRPKSKDRLNSRDLTTKDFKSYWRQRIHYAISRFPWEMISIMLSVVIFAYGNYISSIMYPEDYSVFVSDLAALLPLQIVLCLLLAFFIAAPVFVLNHHVLMIYEKLVWRPFKIPETLVVSPYNEIVEISQAIHLYPAIEYRGYRLPNAGDLHKITEYLEG